MRPLKLIDNGTNSPIESGTPEAIIAARFPVIHGSIRAAPLWHARIGRWVTVIDRMIVVRVLLREQTLTNAASRFEALLEHQFEVQHATKDLSGAACSRFSSG